MDSNRVDMHFEYCVAQSQRLADLIEIERDLETVVRYCDLHIEIDPTERGIKVDEVVRREHTRQALCRTALVMYGRAWESKARSGLGNDFRARLSERSRSFDGVVKALRDKWVAHAVNHFDDTRISLTVSVGTNGVAHVSGVDSISRAVSGFTRDWMIEFRSLCAEALGLLEQDIEKERGEVLSHVRALPIERILDLPRSDNVFRDRALNPRKSRRQFRGGPKKPKE